MGKILGFILWILRLPFKKGEMGGRGQVAIFAALIFQVLFVFFAMVVNVGLLVHHKINLQNSVDLAAYYGAMKQAEVLDAIAHGNYQIRQAWKLLTFHYRGMGMAGNTEEDTPFHGPLGPGQTGWIGNTGNEDQPYSCPASFCNQYTAWNVVANNDNYCKLPCHGQKITLPGQPYGSSMLAGDTLGGLGSIVDRVQQITQNSRNSVTNDCTTADAMNWYALARFVYAFKVDVGNRKKMINLLANSISSSTSDLQDIDGQSVKAGALQTLLKNLTYENQASLSSTGASAGGAASAGGFTFFNSLAAGGCGGTAGDQGTPPKWLVEIFAKPLYAYISGSCDKGQDAVNFPIKILNTAGANDMPSYKGILDPALIQFLLSYIDDPVSFNSEKDRLYHTTMGYEKNPWCMAYVKVSATTTPKIPFSPFAPPQLSATAYAKPFGGRIGPWYYKNWPASADESQGAQTTDQVDQILPPRVHAGEQPVDPNVDTYRADYSRYVGDQAGAKSSMTMARYAKAIFAKDPPTNRIDITWWDYLLDGGDKADLDNVANDSDVLAWDTKGDQEPPIRIVELAAVIPDQFDITHYSIEPNWWRTWAQRIQKRPDFGGLNVRGDLGFRKDGPAPWNTMSVRNQMEKVLPDNTFDFQDPLTYVAGLNHDPKTAYAEVLTSWHTKVPGNYVLDPDRFGKCTDAGDIQGDVTEIDRSAPGDCMMGGHTGYAVKLVDEAAIMGSQEIGGAGNSGQIRNLPSQ